MTDADGTTGLALRDLIARVGSHWPLLAGLLCLAVPTTLSLARTAWSGDLGSHGPIVLATGLWLLWHVVGDMRRQRETPNNLVLVTGLVVALMVYIVGQTFDFLSVEGAALLAVGVMMLYRLYGAGGLRVAGLPLVYLAFVVPPPGWIVDLLTFPLQQAISRAVAVILEAAGYPIAHQGVAIFIGTYQLLVENACSGMNSIVGLTALTLFYIYVLHRASWRYALLLVAMIVPIAMLVNLLRVIVLVLLTYHSGDAVAQGFMHLTTGMVLFACGIGLIGLVDLLFQWLFSLDRKVPA